jgi:hypothetical protein
MAVIPKFVVTASPDGLNALMDLDIDGELDIHPLAGLKGTFTPNLKPGFYPVGDGTYLVQPVHFVIDDDGKLNGDSGIELLSAVDGVANLMWSISFDRARLNGLLLDIPAWSFAALGNGETAAINSLVAVKQGTTTWTGIGAPGYPVDDVQSVNGDTAAQFYTHGTPIGDPLTLPSSAWGSLLGKPDVMAVGDTGTEARAAVAIPAALAIIARQIPGALPKFFSSFADKADGTAPTVFDSGQPVLRSNGPGTNSQAIVLNGVLTSKPTNHGPAAFYHVGHSTDGDITRIGFRFKFHPNELGPGTPTRIGNVCIAICRNDDWSVGPPTMPVHYVLTPDQFSFGVYEGADEGGAGFVVLGSQNFYPALKVDGTTEYEAEAWLDGNTATFKTPDGGQFTLTDDRFADYAGAHFFHENQAQVADTDNRESFTHIWASTGKQFIPNQQKPTWLRGKASVAASTVTVGTPAWTPVNVPGLAAVDGDDYVTIPPSGKVLARFDCWVSRPTAATILAGLAWSGGSMADVVGHDTEGVVQKRIYSTLIVSGLTPGQVFTCNPQIYSSETDTEVIVNPGGNFRAHLTLEPL